MAVEIGALRALLSLDSAAFEKGAKRAQASMSGLQKSLTRTADRMKSIGKTMSTRLTAPIVGASGLMVRSSMQTIDAQAKMAASLETSVVSLQNLDRAASLAGVSQSDLTGSLERMTRRISLAAQEAGPAKDALQRLNLSAENLNNLPVDERINKINTAITEMIPKAEQAGVASQVFGDRTGLAIMRLDPGTIARATLEVERFGVGVTQIDAANIEKAGDSLSGLGLAVSGLGNQLTAALAPVLIRVSEAAGNLAEKFSALSPEMKRTIGITAGIAAAVGPATIAIGLMAAGLAAIVSPIGLVVAGIAGLTTAAIAFWPEIKRAKESLVEFGTQGIDWIKTKFKGLVDFFRTLPAQMMQIGEDIIDGLQAGIMQKWNDLKAHIAGLGSELPGWIKKPLGIESPSKVFMQIGRDLMAGLGIGVANGEALASGPLAGAADRMRGQMDGLQDSFTSTGDRFGDMVVDIKNGTRSLSDILKNLGDRLLSSGISGLASNIFGGGSGGGIFGGIGKAFAGLFDTGGMIPRGQFGIAGERGPEIVTGPARVTSRADTARMMQGGGPQRLSGNATLEIFAPEGFSVRQKGEIQGIAVQVTSEGLNQYDRQTLPLSVRRINSDPRRIG